MKNENNDLQTPWRVLIINFAIEILVYAFLVVLYFYLVLRLLESFLAEIFQNNLVVYAFLGLGLIVAQGVLLEMVTSFILDRLKLERME